MADDNEIIINLNEPDGEIPEIIAEGGPEVLVDEILVDEGRQPQLPLVMPDEEELPFVMPENTSLLDTLTPDIPFIGPYASPAVANRILEIREARLKNLAKARVARAKKREEEAKRPYKTFDQVVGALEGMHLDDPLGIKRKPRTPRTPRTPKKSQAALLNILANNLLRKNKEKRPSKEVINEMRKAFKKDVAWVPTAQQYKGLKVSRDKLVNAITKKMLAVKQKRNADYYPNRSYRSLPTKEKAKIARAALRITHVPKQRASSSWWANPLAVKITGYNKDGINRAKRNKPYLSWLKNLYGTQLKKARKAGRESFTTAFEKNWLANVNIPNLVKSYKKTGRPIPVHGYYF